MCSRFRNKYSKATLLVAIVLPLALQELLAISLPYDHTCPVVYDNDSHDDMYTDEYLLALASAGSIALKGMITSSCGWSEPLFPDPVFVFEWPLAGRSEIVGKALRSGMTNAPTPVAGSGVALVKPVSGVIEDTAPVDTPGAHLIVDQANNASASQPLVVIMGAPPTTVASAYLLDNSITDRVVLAWLGGGPGENQMQNYNDVVDPWATQIVVRRFRTYLFGPVFDQSPVVTKSDLAALLPHTELRQWMIDKNLPNANLPNGRDHDAPPAITLMRPDYIVGAETKSFDYADANGNVFLKDDANGNVMMVTNVNESIGTSEWWRALTNLAAYGGSPLPPVLTPYGGVPAQIPGTIQAENYDYGGPEVAYHDLDVKVMDDNATRSITTFRVTDWVDFDPASGDAGGYALAVAQPTEWEDYTVNVLQSGLYTIDARVASKGAGGSFHIEFDGSNVTGSMFVPDTGDWQNWQTITASNISLTAGQQTMRIVMDTGGVSNLVGDINYVRIWTAGENGPDDDPDGDGFSNSQEDMLGTDPLDADSHIALEISPQNDDSIKLDYQSVVRRLYTIEYKDGFAETNWTSITNCEDIAGTGSITSYIDDGSGTGSAPTATTNRFYRLRVTLPP
ncbi:MAG TPA: carbohydrate-binding protein [Verrucomicrobiae bacterium]|nr:carbohydrate-binding protein [Verrucomicrobiae bacterium]